jgi:two-component system nitrate/nitrite response regulator NarL
MSLVVCDDHDMFLEALCWALEARGHRIDAATRDPAEVLTLVRRHDPDLVLLDVKLPGTTGIEIARELRDRQPNALVVLLTGATEEWVLRAFDTKLVDGLVSKESGIQALESALNRVLAGNRSLVGWTRRASNAPRPTTRLDLLTHREREVLTLISRGASTTAMAASLGVSPNTVRSHVRTVLHKLGVHHRAKAAHAAAELGLTS